MHNSEQSLSNQYSMSAESFEHGKTKRLLPLMETEEMGQPQKRSRSLKRDNASSVGTLEAKDCTKKDNKFKASNFAALRLRIGSWEHKSNSAGLGLKAKIYFNDRKLIWELLVGDLKYKMEIHWSDITALEANCPNNQPGILRIVLGKKPLFFREDNPQPKKQTKWKALSEDFTGGHASTHLEHFLEIAQGVLDKHYHKLIQCDTRLRLLSQVRESISHPPSFVTEAFNSVVGLRHNGGNLFETARGSSSVRGSCISGLQDVAPILSGLNVIQSGSLPSLDKSHEDLFKYTSLSPSSVIGSCATNMNSNSEVENFQNLKDLQHFGVPVSVPVPGGPCPFIGGCVEGYILEEDPPCFETATDINYLDQMLFCGTTEIDEKLMMSCFDLFDSDHGSSTTWNGLVDSQRIKGDEVVEPDVACVLMHENNVQGDNFMGQGEKGHKQQLQGMTDSNVEFLHGLPRALIPHCDAFSYAGN